MIKLTLYIIHFQTIIGGEIYGKYSVRSKTLRLETDYRLKTDFRRRFMDKQKRTTIDEFSAYLQSAVRNTTINYMNDKSKIKEHEITLEEDLENVEGRGIEWNEMMEAHDIFLGKIDPEKLFAQVTDNKLLHILKSFSALHIKVLCLRILYEKTFDEIGMAIGISGKKAENTYYNVIKKIRRELGEGKDAGKRI